MADEQVNNPVAAFLAAKQKERDMMAGKATAEPPASAEPDKPSQPEAKEPTPSEEAAQPQKEVQAPTSVNPKELLDQSVKSLTNGEFDSFEKMIEELALTKKQAAKLKDKFIQDAVDFYNESGNLVPYLEAKAVNYDEWTPEQLIRKKLKEENPEFSDRAFEKLYQKELEKFKPEDEDDEEEKEFADSRLKAYASRIRKEYKEKQQKFTPPVRETPTKEDIVKQESERIKQQRLEFAKALANEEPIKQLYANKKLTFKGPDNQDVEVPIENPQAIFDSLVDESKFFSNLVSKEGNLDFEKALPIYQHAIQGIEYEKSLIKKGYDLAMAKLNNSKLDFTDLNNAGRDNDEFKNTQNELLNALKQARQNPVVKF